MDMEKKMEKLGKLLAECEKGGLLLKAQVDRFMLGLPNMNEANVDEAVRLLQAGIMQAKDLEDAATRFEEITMVQRDAELEDRQRTVADTMLEEFLGTLEKEMEQEATKG